MQVIEASEIEEKTGLSIPHNSHCLANGEIMISTLGVPGGKGRGRYL